MDRSAGRRNGRKLRSYKAASLSQGRLSAKSGQLRRANNPSLKLDGVYETRGDSLRVAPLFIVYVYLKPQKAEIAQLLRSATLKIKFMLAS
ncbi:hypothetical protein [Pseudomonas sp.]|uniref:hypothetical protein n=1 Tax=Pseudomonas sp. TaxID=306 RepID=UPI0026DBFAD5|nr:hypothetical protein [Pseudomonas sp.]MDO4233741.1 hypothetical protein [Pseudomonas sp.]